MNVGMKNGMYRSVLKQIGGLLVLLGLVMVLPIFVSAMYAEWYPALSFLLAAAITAGFGLALFKGFYNSPEPENRHAILIAASGWMMIALMGGLPFFVAAYLMPAEAMQKLIPAGADYPSSILFFRSPLHCLFESMSAYTTTGLSMAVHEPSMGKGMLFYRSLAQWVGGAGFIVLALAVFKQVPGQGSILLYNSETSGVKLKPNVIGTARGIWKVYFGVTAFLTVYLSIGTYLILPDYPLGENIFDAVNHAMCGQSTGGFSTLDDSIAGYKSPAMDVLYLLPMILGSFSLPFFFRVVFEKKFSEIWKDLQTRSLLIAFVLGSAGMAFLLSHAGIVPNPVREGIFQFVSALSTTGWQTSGIGDWDDVSVVYIVTTAMYVGGAAGATVGGIKVIRAVLIQKGLMWQVNKIFYPDHAIKTVKFGGKTLLPDEMNRELAKAATFAFTFLLLVLVGTMITAFYMGEGYTLSDAFFESASAQGTVGLSCGITDPSMSPVVEATYILQMWAGRLEIIPVLALFRALIWGTKPINI
ncbi:MAG: TrkH family potassium uptake protein [Saprospiraceae bacterium]|nr:TrkH family potassium uptake protein [Saprospiraceae bacterium]